MSRFVQLILITAFMVAMLDASAAPFRFEPGCKLIVPDALKSTGIEELQVHFVRKESRLTYDPVKPGIWRDKWSDVNTSYNIVGVVIKPVSGEVSKFEASVGLRSVTVKCITNNWSIYDEREMIFCPKSNPVEIKLNQAIEFIRC